MHTAIDDALSLITPAQFSNLGQEIAEHLRAGKSPAQAELIFADRLSGALLGASMPTSETLRRLRLIARIGSDPETFAEFIRAAALRAWIAMRFTAAPAAGRV